MSDETTYPLEFGEVAPGDGATKIDPGLRWDGLPEGVHTGGAWDYQGEVWKPLDAKPYPNAECRVATKEAEFLEVMAQNEVPFFPRNWETRESNGRRWLVRKTAKVLDTTEYGGITREGMLEIERSIQTVNRLGWTIGDTIVLAWDHQRYEYFILDASSAWHTKDKEDWLVMNFMRRWFPRLATLRDAGATAIQDFRFKVKEEYLQTEKWRWGINYAYASFSRPLSFMWANLPDVDVDTWHQNGANWERCIPHTWIFSQKPIDQEYLDRYELQLAYFRWMED